MIWIEDIGIRRSSLRRNLAMFWQLRGRDSGSHFYWLTIVLFSFQKKVSYNVEITIKIFLKTFL